MQIWAGVSEAGAKWSSNCSKAVQAQHLPRHSAFLSDFAGRRVSRAVSGLLYKGREASEEAQEAEEVGKPPERGWKNGWLPQTQA